MGLKISREMLAPKQLEAVSDLATIGNRTVSAKLRGQNYETLKNVLSVIYDKVEKCSGTRPTQANVVLFFVFGRFLDEKEITHLIESGELHSWEIPLKVP